MASDHYACGNVLPDVIATVRVISWLTHCFSTESISVHFWSSAHRPEAAPPRRLPHYRSGATGVPCGGDWRVDDRRHRLCDGSETGDLETYQSTGSTICQKIKKRHLAAVVVER